MKRTTAAERARYAFLHEIGMCAATGKIGPVDVAHVRYSDAAFGKVNPGMGKKPHWVWTLPLSQEAHREQHKDGERTFWAWKGHIIDHPLRSPLTACLVLEGFRQIGDVDGARAWLARWRM